MKQNVLQNIVKPLLEWYDKNARILPWRDNPSPYRVWISEVMLQQTRVDTVIPYFERFLYELPTVKALAEVDDEKLLKLWEGLGYYSRARNLKKAAQQIMRDYNGVFPSDVSELLKLSGVGSYTAGAVASIAFGVKAPAIDGNVLRVITRITAFDGDITEREIKSQIKKWVEAILPEGKAGQFNQSLMELGAIVCIPNGVPKCDECPVRNDCSGHHMGIAEQFPIKEKKAPRKIENKTVFVIVSDDKVALRQRPPKGLLSGLWELPNTDRNLSDNECNTVLNNFHLDVMNITPLKNAKHIFTHIEWHMKGYLIEAKPEPDCGFNWAGLTDLTNKYTLPSAFKMYIEAFNIYLTKRSINQL